MTASRWQAVTRIEAALSRNARPRVQMVVVLLLTAAAGATASVLLLRAGMQAMWLRYAVSTVPAYIAFFGFIGAAVYVNRSAMPPPSPLGEGAVSEYVNPFALLQLLADADAFAIVVLALGAFFAVGGVVYYAPTFLAELLLEAAFAGALYRRTRALPAGGWARHLFRQTALVALFLAFVFGLAGACMQDYAPEAHSIGGVVRHWMGR